MSAAACRIRSSTSTSAFQSYLLLWKEWQITVLMLTTMCFQVLLVAAGFFRKRLSSSPLRFAVWVAFIGLDAISAYAVGLMLGGGCDAVFAIWAPVLLFHLGAADSITAYSVADNDLWQRHSLKMTLEVMAAGYILSRSGDCPPFLAAGALLFAVGTFKYLERVHALWSGSASQVIRSSRAVYRFMASDRRLEAGADASAAAEHPLIVSGEAAWYANHRLSSASSAAQSRLSDIESVVTYDQIIRCREIRQACRHIYDLCLAFALYKIYRRRLSNLRIHHKDDDYAKVSRVLFPSPAQPSPLRVIRVIEAEVGFIHDGAYTKNGATSGCWWFQGAVAIAARLLSVLLLFVSAVALLAGGAATVTCEEAEVRLPGAVTVMLVFTCLVVEIVQAFKMVRSNRMRVWLACAYVVERRRQRRTPQYSSRNRLHRRNAGILLAALRYAGQPFRRSIWHERIDQRSIVADAIDAVRWRSAARFDMDGYRFATAMREDVLRMAAAGASDVHYFLVEKVGERFAGVGAQELARKRDGIARAVRFPLEGGGQAAAAAELRVPEFSAASDSGLEAVLLNWHLATSVCERDLYAAGAAQRGGGGIENEAAKMGVALSRYCLYLLVDCTKLTPADGEVCVPLYDRMKRRLESAFREHPATMDIRRYCETAAAAAEGEAEAAEVLAKGIELGKRIAEKWEGAAERWAVLAEVWVDIMVYMAIAENAHPHTEALGRGGELLTHLWVLLGHLGLAHSSWVSRPHVSSQQL